MDDHSMEELLRRIRAGDEEALERLFELSLPVLEDRARRDRNRGAPRAGLDRPSDIAQETALRAFDQFASFRGTTAAEWRAWLGRIFENRRAQGRRDARRRKRDVRATRSLDGDVVAGATTASQWTASAAVAHDEHWRRTLGHIFELPDDQRDAIWMCHLKERPVAEVARALGKTEAAISGLLRRGLQTLRTRNAGDPGEARETPARDGAEQAAAALLSYLRRRDAGESIERSAFLAEHTACTDELSQMLGWIDYIESILPGKYGA